MFRGTQYSKTNLPFILSMETILCEFFYMHRDRDKTTWICLY